MIDSDPGDENDWVMPPEPLVTEMPGVKPGIYSVTLYGRGGGTLYRAIFTVGDSFIFDCPSHYEGMLVYGFEIKRI